MSSYYSLSRGDRRNTKRSAKRSFKRKREVKIQRPFTINNERGTGALTFSFFIRKTVSISPLFVLSTHTGNKISKMNYFSQSIDNFPIFIFIYLFIFYTLFKKIA